MRNVYVFGGANIDIIGRSDSKIQFHDSNIGKVIQTYGGVGRNIAENIARYGANVHFVSVFGNDEKGRNCIQYCEDLGMDMQDCILVEGETTSCYLAVLDETGDMILAINDMDVLRFMTIEHISKVLKKINKEDLLVLDTNLDQEILDYILTQAPCDIYVDPISCKKAEKIRHHLASIHTLKPNIYEASSLSGIEYQGMESVDQMGEYFLSKGIKEIFISLGKEGAKVFTQDRVISCKCENVAVVNATGAGDAFMGGIVIGKVLHYDLMETIQFASAASVCTIETGASVCKNLTLDLVNERKKNLQFEIQEEIRCI